MSRKILFKAKRKDNGEWVEGYVVLYPSGKAEIHKISKELPDILLKLEVEPETLCQYTGLTDKNGRKIWENDIVTITLECNDYLIPSETGIVEYSYGQYELKVKAPDGQNAYSDLINKLSEAPFEIEKLGNIFDNPELLEVEQ